MDNTVINVATMEPEQIKDYQMLFNNVILQKLEHNEKQVRTWNEYKVGHKKIIEGLQIYPLSLSENCMIPIGKRALMKGKLTHTNEVLVYLGCDYFVKYSASQAIALCNRRISYADEMLKSLEIERNFYEMKQLVPLQYDAFGETDRKDILEHWNKDTLDEWRVQHKQREKDYHQKLAKLREEEKSDVQTEEDLFRRLDELELEEELEDEICRLEQNQSHDNLKDGEVYDESDDTSDSDVITTKMIEEELRTLKKLYNNKVASQTSKLDSEVTQNKILNTNPISNDFKDTSQHIHKRRVSFVESSAENEDSREKETCVSQTDCFVSQNDIDDEDSENENDIIRIEFSHSSYIPVTIDESNREIKSPADIYKVFGAPKSILKRSPNDMIPNEVASSLYEDDDTETEDENDRVRCSIYNSVVKEEVQDKKISTDVVNNTPTTRTNKKEIVSRFKLSRAKKSDT